MMTFDIRKNIYGWLILLPLLAGCQADELDREGLSGGTASVRLAALGMSDGTASDKESEVNTLMGCRFENGMLEEVLESLEVDETGVCSFTPAQMRGEMYFLANASAAMKDISLNPGQTSESDFLHFEADAESMTSEGILMTGKITLASPEQSATLRRSVARIDLDSSFGGVEVHKVTVKGMASSGYVNMQAVPAAPESAETADIVKSFGDKPFSNGKETLFYVCEQGGGPHDVELSVTVDGVWHRLRTELSSVKRNTVYTLKVYGNGAGASVEIVSGSWESGASSDSELQLDGRVDRQSSVLSEGVEISEAGDTVYVPYWKSSMRIVLQAEAGLSVKINGRANGVTAVSDVSVMSAEPIAAISVESERRMPGTLQEYVYIDLYKEDVLNGRIVLAFAPNPIQIQGRLKFDADGVCDFGTYVDGELSVMSVAEGKTVTVDIDPEEAPWLKIDDANAPDTYRLLGGWKPNDPAADGRVQTARLILSDTESGHKETYTVKRRNWGLPVVNINGTWWCKYNLRGNVKDFNDQILVKDDPVEGDDVGAYLSSCSDEQFKALLGDQYQGGNPEGMKVKHEGGKFYYEGFQETAEDFGALAATQMAPDGYAIPDYNDYRFFTNGNDMELKLGSGVFNNLLGQRLSFNVTEREMSFDGLSYGKIKIYDYKVEGTDARWTILGLGGQFGKNPGELSNMIVLLATSGKKGQTWFLEGYGSGNGNRTWFKYTGNDSKKTRTIRCVKTPVEYIYD